MMKRFDVSLLRSILKDAETIKRLAIQCYDMRLLRSERNHDIGTSSGDGFQSEYNPSSELLETIRCEIKKEFLCLFKIFEQYGTKVISHEVIHLRIEYLLQVINFVFEFNYIHIFHSDIVGSCFTLYKWVLSFLPAHATSMNTQEDDILSVTNTVSPIEIYDDTVEFPENHRTEFGKTNWYEMCVSSLAMMISRLLQQFPNGRNEISISTSETLSLLQSECWQIQYLSLAIIQAALVLETNQNIGANTNQLESSSSSNKIPTPLTKATSSRSDKLQAASTSTSQKSSANKSSGKPTPSKKPLIKSKSTLIESTSTVSEVNAIENIGRRPLLVTTPVKTSEELYRSGFLRTLSWLLLHRNRLVRVTASQVLEIILHLTTNSEILKSMKTMIAPNHDNRLEELLKPSQNLIISDFWSSLMEQGILPLLQSISVGYSINSEIFLKQSTQHLLFPETHIRRGVQILFQCLVYQLQYNQQLQQRLIQSLNHSGNLKLRVNLISSIIIACNHSNKLGRLLLSNTTTNNGTSNGRSAVVSSLPTALKNINTFLWAFISSLIEVQNDFKPIFSIFNYFIDLMIQNCQKMLYFRSQQEDRQMKRQIGNEIATQTLENQSLNYHHGFSKVQINSIHPKLLQLMISISKSIMPVVIIVPTGTPIPMANEGINASTRIGIRMSCPNIELVEKYGGKLYNMIQKQHLLQIEQCFIFFQEYFSTEILSSSSILSAVEVTSSTFYQKYEREFKSIHNNLNDYYFVKLEGSYQLWQEIFGHFTDSVPLFHSFLQKLSFSQILECLLTASMYSMSVLMTRYFNVILQMKKISAATLLPIINCMCTLQPYLLLSSEGFDDNPSIVSRERCVYLYLLVYRECIRYLISDYQFLLKKKKVNELQEIMKRLNTPSSNKYIQSGDAHRGLLFHHMEQCGKSAEERKSDCLLLVPMKR